MRFFLLFIFLLAGILYPGQASGERWTDDHLRILTYNIFAGGQDCDPVYGRQHEWLEVIRSQSPDILLIQEANGWLPADSNYIAAYVESLNVSFPGEPPYTGWVGDANSPYDPALITRLPVTSVETITTAWLDGDRFDLTHGFLHATLADSAGPIHIVDVHFKSGPSRTFREKEARVLLQVLDGIPPDEIVWVAGDFNSYSPVDVEPGSPTPPAYDLGAPSAEETGWEPVSYLLDRGFRDAFRLLHPLEVGYTRPTREFYGYPLEPSGRVDFVLRSPMPGWILETAEVVADGPADLGSDHYAVFAAYRRGILTSVADPEVGTARPGLRCRPNPFASRTTIDYEVPRAGRVEIDVYSVTGRHVRRLFAGDRTIGVRALQWDGRDDDGRPVPQGWYCVRMVTPAACSTLDVLFLK